MMKNFFKVWPVERREFCLLLAALAVLVASVLLALPALWVPLGLPAEGDAVDYRVPLLRWILRHRELPNWQWTMVDDYPLLGELLMLPFFEIGHSLARVVPIFAFVGLAAVGGSLASKLGRAQSGLGHWTLFFLGAAWVINLRPMALQANLLMVDNLASFFLLGSFAFLLHQKVWPAAIFAACAMATRYTTWATAAVLPFFLLAIFPAEKRWRSFFIFSAVAILGPLPFMIRNFFLNDGNIFYPIGNEAAMRSVAVDAYGRGKDALSFLILPYDILYTNSFVKGIFDYTVGKLFYVQLAAALVIALLRRAAVAGPRKYVLLALGLCAVHTLVWFASGQQLRFLVPTLVILNIFMLLITAKSFPTLLVVTLLGVFSAVSIQRDSLKMAFGLKASIFSPAVAEAENCFAIAGISPGEAIGFINRDGILGFFDHDFVFLKGHPYSVGEAAEREVNWIYSKSEMAGFRGWPEQSPCLLKRKAP